MHWQGVGNGVNTPFLGLMMRYRDEIGIDLQALRNKVNRTLNGHNSILILDGCSKQASCGCRINVKFNVDFLLSKKGRTTAAFDKEILLFHKARRADAGSWGEEVFLQHRPTRTHTHQL